MTPLTSLKIYWELDLLEQALQEEEGIQCCWREKVEVKVKGTLRGWQNAKITHNLYFRAHPSK